MDIRTADGLIAEASDALARGQHPEAVELYQSLMEAYSRFSHFEDAQIAIGFNHLCAALTLNSEQEHLKAAQRLLNLFLEQPPAKTLTCEVATRLYRLLRDADGLFPQSLQEQLMEACAPYAFELHAYAEPRLSLEEPPPPHHLTLMRPSDAGLLSYLMVAHCPDSEELAPWLRTISLRHQMSERIRPDVEEVFAYLRDQLSHTDTDYVNAYLSLLSAFEWAVHAAPGLAFEWLVGLLGWELIESVREGLILQLSRPIERRSLLTITLHKRHAEDLINEADGARLALHHWQEVIQLAEFLLEIYHERELERGQRNLGDVQASALVSLDLAQAYLIHGDHIQALSILSAPLKDAEREGFTDPTVAPLVFRMQGAILERMGALEDAVNAYERAGKLSKLTFFTSDPYDYSVDVLACELTQGLNPELVEVSACAIADYFRAWAQLASMEQSALESLEPWRMRVEWIQTLLVGARELLPYDQFIRVMLYIELTLCMLDDVSAPQRALGYARALKHNDAVTLCELYLLKQSFLDLDEQPELLTRAILEHRRLIEEARRGGRGSIMRRVALQLVSLLCRLLELPEAQRLSGEAARLIAELDRDIEHYTPLIARSPINQRVGRYDLLLPECRVSEPQRAIQALIKEGRWESARLISSALRHLNHQTLYTPHRRDFAEQIHRRHQERFEHVWIHGGETLQEHLDEYQSLLQKVDSDQWVRPTQVAREARLEFKVFEEKTLAMLIPSQSGEVIGTELALSRRESRGLIERYKRFNSQDSYSAEDNSQLIALLKELYQALIAPFSKEIERLHRLIISADHPLHELPFCALCTPSGTFLVEQVEVLMAEVCSDRNIPTQALESRDCLVAGSSDQVTPVIHTLSPLQEERRFSMVQPLSVAHFRGAYQQEVAAAQLLCLRGSAREDAFVMTGEEGERWVFTMRALSQSIAAFQPACVLIADPVSRRQAQPIVRTALSAAHVAVVAIHRMTPLMQTWVTGLFQGVTNPYLRNSYSASITQLRRLAIRNRYSPLEWSAFEVYISDEYP